MADHERVLAVVREWILKAENDLDAASILMRYRPKFPTDVVCFHAQQCVEKYLKAYLVYREMEFPKTHGIGFLLNLIPETERPEISATDQALLTAYASGIRYPGWIDLTPEDAWHAVKVAKKVRTTIRRKLPKSTYRTEDS